MAKHKRNTVPKKEHFVGIRMSEDLYEAVSSEAKRAHLSVSEYFRKLALNHKIKVYEEKVFYDKSLLKKLGDLGRIGNNLNQIARYLNESGKFDDNLKKEVKSCVGILINMRDEILNEAGEYRYGDS